LSWLRRAQYRNITRAIADLWENKKPQRADCRG